MITILEIGGACYLVPSSKVSALTACLTSLTPLRRGYDRDGYKFTAATSADDRFFEPLEHQPGA